MPRCAHPGNRRAAALVGSLLALTLVAGCSLLDSRAAETDSDSGVGTTTAPFTPTPSPSPTTEAVTEARHAASDLVERRVARW